MKKKFFIIPFLSIGIVVSASLVYSHLVIPELTKAQNQRATFQIRADALTQYQEVANIVQQRLAQYRAEPQIANLVNDALPSKDSSAGILEQLRGIASNQGLVLDNVEMDSVDSDIVGRLTIRFSLDADYDALKLFLATLEKNIRIMDIQEVSFTKSGVVRLAVNAYYQK